MKHSLKTLTIGFECPVFDLLKDKNLNDELNSNLIDPKFSFFTILKNDLELLKISNNNYVILYTLVVLINNNTIAPQQADEEWNKLGDSILNSIRDYLTKQNIQFFRKLN
jgi:hypothetical protein